MGGLACTWHLERETRVVRHQAEEVLLATSRRQARFRERYRTAQEHYSALVHDFDRGSVWRRAALDPHLHLRIDLTQQQMSLVSDGFVLRKISLAGEGAPGKKAADGVPQLDGLARGTHVVATKLQGEEIRSTDWWKHDDGPGASGDRDISGVRFLEMNEGTVIVGGADVVTSRHMAPGVIELPQVDFSAIFGAVSAGTQVYVY